jgi:hypothetical protein
LKSIYIVLTKTDTIVARAIRWFTGATYSHASLSLNHKLCPMYSFARKYVNFPFIGTMVKEEAGAGVYGKFSKVPCCILRIPVSDNQYDEVKKMVDTMWHSHQYRYNYFGLVLNYLGISKQHDKRFFCSEFVYYVLGHNNIIDLGKPPSLVKPQDFLNTSAEIIYEGNLNDLKNPQLSMQNPISAQKSEKTKTKKS